MAFTSSTATAAVRRRWTECTPEQRKTVGQRLAAARAARRQARDAAVPAELVNFVRVVRETWPELGDEASIEVARIVRLGCLASGGMAKRG